MAATVTMDTINGRGSDGSQYYRRGTMTLGTYAAGGVAVTHSTFELPATLDDLRVDSAGGYVARFDKANLKVMLYQQKDPAAAGGADIPLPEVGAVDVSATAFRFEAKGK